jgi:hypothetical protein
VVEAELRRQSRGNSGGPTSRPRAQARGGRTGSIGGRRFERGSSGLGRPRQQPFWCPEASAETSTTKGATGSVSGQAMSLGSMVKSHGSGQHAPRGATPSGWKPWSRSQLARWRQPSRYSRSVMPSGSNPEASRHQRGRVRSEARASARGEGQAGKRRTVGCEPGARELLEQQGAC